MTKLRYPICLALLVLYVPHIRPSLFLPGFLVSLLGELIQIWSFASLDKNRTLGVQGPYVLTRNPMYIGRFFLLLGFLILTGNIWIILIFTALYYFYMVNRVKREETKLRLFFGERYEDYCMKVNRFVPSFRFFGWNSLLFFRKRLFFQNHGHWNLLGMLACYVVFYFTACVIPRI